MRRILLLSTLLTTASLMTVSAHAQQAILSGNDRVERLKTTIPAEVLQNYRVNACSFLQSPNQSQVFLQCRMEPAYPLNVPTETSDIRTLTDPTENPETPVTDGRVAAKERKEDLTSEDFTADPNNNLGATTRDEAIKPAYISEADISEGEMGCGGGEWIPSALWVGKIDAQGTLTQNWLVNESILTEKNFSSIDSVSDQGQLFALSSGFDHAGDHLLTKILGSFTNQPELSFQETTVLKGDFTLKVLANQQIIGMEISEEEGVIFANIKRMQPTDGQVLWNVDIAKLAADNHWHLSYVAYDVTERPNHSLLVYGAMEMPEEKEQSRQKRDQPSVLSLDQLNAQPIDEEISPEFLLCLSEAGQIMGAGMIQQEYSQVVTMPDNTVRFISMIDPDMSNKYPQLVLRSVDNNCHVSARQSVNLPARPIQDGVEIYVVLESIVLLTGNEMAVLYKQTTIADAKQETIVYMLAKIDQNGKVVLDIPITEVFNDTDGNFGGLNANLLSIPSVNQVFIAIVNDTILENAADPERFLAVPRLYKVNLNE